MTDASARTLPQVEDAWRTTDARPVFRSVLCAVDERPEALIAVRQAVAMTDPDAHLTLMAVVQPGDLPLGPRIGLSPQVAQSSLAKAARLAEKEGTVAEVLMDRSDRPAEALVRRAADHDLLVLGAPQSSRALGIFGGSTATAVAHRAHGAVLLARGPSLTRDWPDRILVASDCSSASDAVVGLVARLARHRLAHHRKVKIKLVHVSDRPDRSPPARLTAQATALREAAAGHVTVRRASGPAQDAIVELADRHRTSLVVVGSGGRRGLGALGSVSERVTHAAPCSVLVVRPQ